jgi:hypothetical protein
MEWNEFAQASQIFQPMSLNMATRFTTGKEMHVDASKGGIKMAEDLSHEPALVEKVFI